MDRLSRLDEWWLDLRLCVHYCADVLLPLYIPNHVTQLFHFLANYFITRTTGVACTSCPLTTAARS